MKRLFPMNLQFFAEPAPEGGEQTKSEPTQPGTSAPAIDYAKIQQMLDGTLAAKEDTALKAYFKQQGLSQEEAEQAMSAFKAEKAKKQPDVGAMQAQLSQAQAAAQQAQVQSAATMEAVSLGIEAKIIPYVLKMEDLSKTIGQDGTINSEEIKNAINKVLEDVPALKPQAVQASGFAKVVDVSFPFIVATIVAVWIICNEIISILENMLDIGVELPLFLMPLVKYIKKQVEEKGETNVQE